MKDRNDRREQDRTPSDLLDDTCDMRRPSPEVSQSDPRRPQAEYVN